MKKLIFFMYIISCLQVINLFTVPLRDRALKEFGLIHIAILEGNVPEFKDFRQKLRALFFEKDDKKKAALLKNVFDSGQKIISQINSRLSNEKLTDSQKNSLNIVKTIIQKKLEQLRS